MKILYIVSGLQKASGVTVFVEELAKELRETGHLVDVLTRSQISDFTSFIRSDYDIVHIHGLWDLFLHRLADTARKADIKIVWSPHGMLQKWALKNKWWKKFVALALYQWWDLRSAALLHATAQSEVDDIRRLKLKNKVVIAPLGVRIPAGDASFDCRAVVGVKTLLFVSRVQRKKGLLSLIEAWSRLPKDLRNGWRVRIVGPDQDNHTSELKTLCDRFGVEWYDCLLQSNSRTIEQSNIVFVGPLYGAELNEEYAKADLFVLPTHSENFGSVVVEALAHGVPVITTKEAPWAELDEYKCGWWIDDDIDKLTMILQDAIRRDDLREMGGRGRKLVEERYTWSAVCDKMIRGYEEVLNGRA